VATGREDVMKSVGIIGFGSFGKFLAERLNDFCEVRVFSRRDRQNKWATELAEVAASDFIILAIPIGGYREVLDELKPLIKPDSVIVDVCSVKQEPVRIIKEMLPEQPLVATHPLFGPESAAQSLRGHTLAICPEVSDGEAVKAIEHFAESFGVEVVKLDVQEHDREMAIVQGLTFFIARTLAEFGLRDQQLSTPSFKELLDIEQLEEKHSPELFYTIQTGNPEAQAVREKFLQIAANLHKDIGGHLHRKGTDRGDA
jgi:prephenate dehydrogenase